MVNVGKYTIHGSYGLLINGVYWAYNPLILTIDPNFQRDIQGIFERSTPSWRSVSSAPNAKVHRSLKCGPSKSSQTIGEEGSVMFGQPLCFSLTKVRSVLFFSQNQVWIGDVCVCVCLFLIWGGNWKGFTLEHLWRKSSMILKYPWSTKNEPLWAVHVFYGVGQEWKELHESGKISQLNYSKLTQKDQRQRAKRATCFPSTIDDQ